MSTSKPSFSPQPWARAGGAAYLIIIVLGFAGEMLIRNKLIVSGDPAATAHNILAHPLLWRLGIAGDITMHICDAVVGVVYYVLLKPVNKNLALMALKYKIKTINDLSGPDLVVRPENSNQQQETIQYAPKKS